jgi:hypothetical protein
MGATVIVFGTSHLYQFGEVDAASLTRFLDRLTQVCTQHKATCIAEEMSKDSLSIQKKAQSTVAALCEQLGVKHAYCDPPVCVHESLGIENPGNTRIRVQLGEFSDQEADATIAANDRTREQYWLKELLNIGTWPLVFVCGADHVEAFATLVKDNGIDVVIVERRWNPLSSTSACCGNDPKLA